MNFREYHQTAKNIMSLISVLVFIAEYICLPVSALSVNSKQEIVKYKTYSQIFTVSRPITNENDNDSSNIQQEQVQSQSAPAAETKTNESEVIEYHSEDTSISHSYIGKLTKNGGIYYNSNTGLKETWYSQRVLPGNGLSIPGRHVDERGFVCDEEGYICVASSIFSKGTVIETSNGMGKVYDSGCKEGILDVYTNW
jgi:hypothetical protein